MENKNLKPIKLNKISKIYRIYEQPTDRLKQFISNYFAHETTLDSSSLNNKKKYYKEHWALNSISFDVPYGHTVGILGRNGSGKSTLLQIVSGILKPTSGEIDINGRIAALLELGAGFNPELSGKENIYTNGLILGMSLKEISDKFNDIVEFSELGDVIDLPVKTYSSGMFVRLAFSIAINTSPDILVIDEALSVGDEAFQRKCFSKISSFQDHGGTLLFVSHNSTLILELCDYAILLEKGNLILADTPKNVVNQYQKLLYTPEKDLTKIIKKIKNSNTTNIQGHSKHSQNDAKSDDLLKEIYDPKLISTSKLEYENNGAQIFDANLCTKSGDIVNLVLPNKQYIFKYKVKFNQDKNNIKFGALIKTISGLELGGYTTNINQDNIHAIKSGDVIEVTFNFNCNLTPGTYFFNAGVACEELDNKYFVARCVDILMFKVLPVYNKQIVGTVDFSFKSLIKAL